MNNQIISPGAQSLAGFQLTKKGRAVENSTNIIIYTAEDGQTKIDVQMDGETLWLSQIQMADLFQTTKQNIGQHIRNIFIERELEPEATVKDFFTVQKEGQREVKRELEKYNLDVIISVGYRISSHIGTKFRIWATQKLKEYIIKGFVMDDNRLANGGVRQDYFEEWAERVRKIRTSERNFYLKVTDVFATSVDYSPKTDYAQCFFATVQNKFHYAITGQTAAELVASRVSASKTNMGLTNWQGEIITSEQAKVAKNYLEELELKRLRLLVEQFLSFAELRALEKHLMYMKDWVAKLDAFLVLNEKEILTNAGKMSHDDMELKVREELEKFNERQLNI